MYKFRLLRPDEIECRVGRVKAADDKGSGGVSLLLYKTARTDANLLDETVGPDKWQNDFELIDGTLFGRLGVDYGNGYVWKMDAGVESNTEAEKGRASDAFKRAGSKHGIGRELYTAPFIWVSGSDCKITIDGRTKKPKCNDTFTVRKIEYDSAGTIIGLVISNDKTRKIVYTFGTYNDPDQRQKAQERPQEAATSAQTAPDGNLYCIDCGQQILPVTDTEGNIATPERVVKRSLKRYHCQLCWDCQVKRDESKAG